MKHLTTKELRQILDATHDDDVIQFKDVKDKVYKAKGLTPNLANALLSIEGYQYEMAVDYLTR